MGIDRRRAVIESLAHAIDDDDWALCSEYLFQILYGLPYELELEIACFMSYRYLDIFETRFPKLKWPRKILSNLIEHVDMHGNEIPDEPDDISAADGAFMFCLIALINGCYYREDPITLTSCCACAITSAINARMTNAWIADDPIAYRIWQRSELLSSDRSVFDNVASKAIRNREWMCVLDRVVAKQVWDFPNDIDPKKIANIVRTWNESERQMLLPNKAR